MAALAWDQTGEHVFETGIRKGVLYPLNGTGIPWNGLTSVDVTSETETEPVYFDGKKINDIVSLGSFSASLKALTYPDEFTFYEGAAEDTQGFFVMNQFPSRFGLSYQTLVSDDLSSEDYKIHLVYNVLAVPSSKTYETVSEETSPTEFEWTITAVPQEIEGHRPTAHVVIDSRKLSPPLLTAVEGILYGDTFQDAHLPPLKTFANYIRGF